MTVLTTDNRRSYAGDGSTTLFAFPVFFLEEADVKVALRVNDVETSPVFNVDYTVSGAGNPGGGSVTFMVAPASGATVVLFNDPALTQTVDYQDNDEFPAETHERALDKLTLVCQRITARLGRMLQYDETETEVLSASDLIGRVQDAETARDAAQVAQSAAETAEAGAETAATSASTAASTAATDAASSVSSQLSGFVGDAEDARDAAQAAQLAAEAVSPPFPIAQVTGLQPALDAASPPATIAHFARMTPPIGWLIANGSAVSRATYTDLYEAMTFTDDTFDTVFGSVSSCTMDDTSLVRAGFYVEGPGIPVGTTVVSVNSSTSLTISQNPTTSETNSTVRFLPFGHGDGSMTFNLPDLRGEFIRGWDDGRGIDSDRAFGSVQLDAMQQITGQFGAGRWIAATESGAFSRTSTTASRMLDGNSTGNVVAFDSAHSPGSRTASETRPRNTALLACIKT